MTAGAENVVLVVDLCASLAIRVRGYERSPDFLDGVRRIRGAERAYVRSQRDRRYLQTDLDPTGRARFRGLVAGEAYTLSILGLPGGRYVLARDLRPRSDEVVVEMQKGESIRGRVVLPAGVVPRSLSVNLSSPDGLHTHARGDPKTGRFEVQGLPQVTWTVHVSAWVDGKRYEGEAGASTGGEVEIRLVER